MGEWEWAGTHYFPLTSPFSVISFFCLCLFFLIGRDISHGEENGEEVEKVKVRSLSHVRLCATP